MLGKFISIISIRSHASMFYFKLYLRLIRTVSYLNFPNCFPKFLHSLLSRSRKVENVTSICYKSFYTCVSSCCYAGNLVTCVRVQVFDKERVTSYLDVEFLPMNVTFDGISMSLRVWVGLVMGQIGWNIDICNLAFVVESSRNVF